MPDRDRFVDCFKGLLILWVIHIHTVFWSGDRYLPEIARQMSLLIDVPAFFFISGYLVRPPGVSRLFRRPLKQFARLYLRYLAISCLVLSGLFLFSHFRHGTDPASLIPEIKSMVRLRPTGGLWNYVRVYDGSLWFVRVYLPLLVFTPLVIGLANFRRLKPALPAFLLLLFSLLRYQGWDRPFMFTSTAYIAFYLVFFLLGLIYREKEDTLQSRHLGFMLLVNLLLCGVVYHLDGRQFILQENKFPPTFQYLVYSLPLVLIFALAKRLRRPPGGRVLRRVTRLLTWCGMNIFSIYLFQGVACSMPFIFIPSLEARFTPFRLYWIVLAFNTGLSLLLTLLFVQLEKGVTLSLAALGKAKAGRD